MQSTFTQLLAVCLVTYCAEGYSLRRSKYDIESLEKFTAALLLNLVSALKGLLILGFLRIQEETFVIICHLVHAIHEGLSLSSDILNLSSEIYRLVFFMKESVSSLVELVLKLMLASLGICVLLLNRDYFIILSA